MTFIYELDQDIMEIYLYSENEVRMSRRSKVKHQTLKLTLTSKFYLDLDPMNLICEPGLDTLKMYLPTKNEVFSLRHSKVIH